MFWRQPWPHSRANTSHLVPSRSACLLCKRTPGGPESLPEIPGLATCVWGRKGRLSLSSTQPSHRSRRASAHVFIVTSLLSLLGDGEILPAVWVCMQPLRCRNEHLPAQFYSTLAQVFRCYLWSWEHLLSHPNHQWLHVSSLRSNCAHTSARVDLISWNRCITKKLFINQSFVRCKMPQGDLIVKAAPCWILWQSQASFGKVSNCKPLFWFLCLNFCLWFSLRGRGGWTLALVLDIVNICVYSCASRMFHLLLMPIGMGSSHGFWMTLWHRQEAPDYSVLWRHPSVHPRRHTPNEKVGLHLEILQCRGGS